MEAAKLTREEKSRYEAIFSNGKSGRLVRLIFKKGKGMNFGPLRLFGETDVRGEFLPEKGCKQNRVVRLIFKQAYQEPRWIAQ